MISKLPKWVWLGGAVLAFSAGMVNVIALLGFAHKAATHVTGIFSLFSISIFEAHWENFYQTFFVIFSFFTGSFIAGILIRDAHLRMGRRYGAALAIECGLLLMATYGFVRGWIFGEYFASMAAGLQNAMASTYSGAIIRTTHLTGILTDFGVLIGNKFAGVSTDRKRIALLAIILSSFTCGGLLGAFSYHLLGALAMVVPAIIIGVSAVAYEIFRRRIAHVHQ